MIDARLAAPALAAWAAVALVLLSAQAAQDRLSRALLVASLVALVAMAAGLATGSPTIAGAAVAVLAGCVIAVLHATALWSGPVADLAERGRTVVVTAVIQAEPRAVPGRAWQSGPQGLVPLATSSVEVDGRRISVAVPMTLACACDADDVQVGGRVTIRGRLSPGRDPGSAATLRMRGGAAIVQDRPPGLPDVVASGMRAGLRQALSGLEPEPAALVAGLSTGDTSRMPPLLADRMKASGLSHLTAVSGANVAIVVGCILALAGLLRLPLRLRVILALAGILGFVLLVRPEPSVVRAAVMGAVVVIAMLSGGRRAGPAVLAVAVLLVTLLAPALAVSWAFALSVTATLGIVLGASRIPALLPARTPTPIALAAGVTIAAQLATLPVLLLMGASASWVSIPANLVAEVLVAPITVLGLLAAILAPAAMPVAILLAHLAAIPATLLAAIPGWAIRLPGASVAWPTGVAGLVLLVAVVLLVVLARRRWHRSVRVVLVLVLVVVLLDPPGSRAWPPPGWVVVACDVGQGDALVIRGRDDAVMVVDVGPDASALTSCLADLGVRRIGVLVLTHFHADHVDGLAAAYALPVGAVLVSPIDEPPETFAAADRLLRSHAVRSPVRTAAPGMRITLPGIEATVLWPARRLEAGSVPNNGSIVLQVEAQGVSILLPGDVEREAQAEIAHLPRPRIDVLKAPHHGSANLDPSFVRWAQAPVTLISVGDGNDYGHPAPAALQAWGGGTLGRTDVDGALAIVRSAAGLALVRRG